MATKTSFLKLIKGGRGEFTDTWDEPLNSNFDAIDEFCNDVNTELSDARFTLPSLKEFLEVGHETDGSLKAIPEEVAGRNSQIYGDKDLTSTDFTLKSRMDAGDKDVFDAREGAAGLRAALAAREVLQPNMLIDGTKNGFGQPTWMGFTGANVQVDGSLTSILMFIDGYKNRIRTLKQVTISGASGTKYVYADFNADGQVVIDGDSSTPPPASATGTTSNGLDSKPRIFTDTTIPDWTLTDVKAGDRLEILTAADAGIYFIKTVAPGGNLNELEIVGLFPVGNLTALNYKIYDPLAVTLGFATSETPAAGRLFIGEADFNGTNVTAVRARHYKDVFVGDWRSYNLGTPAIQEEIWSHHLGSLELEVVVQVSQANDGSQPVELMSLSEQDDQVFTPGNGSLSFSPSNGSLAVSSVVLSSGDQTVSTQPALTGTVGGSLTGTAGGALSGTSKARRSVRMQFTRNLINVKNIVNNILYRDYGGTDRTTGYVRVIVRKRG